MLHLGLYWSKISREYPNYAIQPALAPDVEQFETSPKSETAIGIRVVPEPDLRVWYISDSKTHLLQVQRDRFILNWRKVVGDEIYPRYDSNRPKFQEEWGKFCSFITNANLGSINVNQCEVTYVNHIELGKGWKSFGEAHKVFGCLTAPRENTILANPEMVRLDTRFLMPGHRGRLYISFEPTLRRKDAKEALQVTLTARGKPDSSTTEDILKWFDLGHEWIVNGFTEFTTQTMHGIWGKRI